MRLTTTTKKHNQTFVTHAPKELLETVKNIPEVASLKAATVLDDINQPSISAISRKFVGRLVSLSFTYSL